jgi:hypothetical protein
MRCAGVAVEFLGAIRILIQSLFSFNYTSKCLHLSGSPSSKVLATVQRDTGRVRNHVPGEERVLFVLNYERIQEPDAVPIAAATGSRGPLLAGRDAGGLHP